MSKETIHALVDFHEGKYTIPESYSALAHQVLAADNLGDEVFLDYICHELNVPLGRINSSNRTQDVKMALRDRMKLKSVVAQLQTVKRCFVCQSGFMSEMEVTAVVACCGRMFHSTCIVGVYTCPFCNEPWGGLPCVVCKKPTCSPHNCEPHVSFEWRRRNRMQCCGVISTLGASNQFAQHVEPVQQKNMILRRLLCCGERRGGMKIRDERYKSEHCIHMVVDSGLSIVPATPQCIQYMVVDCPLPVVT